MENELRYKETLEDAYYIMKKSIKSNTDLSNYFLTVEYQDFLLDRCRYVKEKFESYEHP